MARPKSVSSSPDPLRRWSIADSLETYSISRWGSGYVSINDKGNLLITPRGPEHGSIDLKALVEEIKLRGIPTPILLRFSDILRSRIELLNQAFGSAIAEYEYRGQYRGVYPIKVNQSRIVVQEIIEFGRPYHYGLEAGSKPELLAVMAVHDDPDALIICNGYKDDEYIETALSASRLGRKVVLVIEKPDEIDHIHSVAQSLGIRPTVGMRARLSARGAGRWEQSGGDRSKFGLSPAEMLQAVDKLRSWGQLDGLELLHFHLGSQISSIRSIKTALREAGRLFVELHKLGCEGLQYFDVGGGLGVDYDGSQTNFASSMNYTVQEYANDVVFTIQEICDEAEVPHPNIVTESGRAVAAHHSVLVVDVLAVSEFQDFPVPAEIEDEDAPQLLRNLHETFQAISVKNVHESYHDALEYKEQVLQLFNLGHLSLEHRVLCEQIFWATCQRLLAIVRNLPHVPEELESLNRALADTYFCNFSTFQSLPDSWAVGQLFPIVPIHRLDEEPTRRGILADITCDSDGKIDQFIDMRDVKRYLELHRPGADEYYLGMFLVGAYQEILGDMHNLFGDTYTVHVSLDEDGNGYSIDEVVPGDTVSEVLRYVGYEPSELLRRVRQRVEHAVRQNWITLEEARQLIARFSEGLSGYTYLEPTTR
ncbi:biosynthetic arginine decarboxylase [Haliangium ochraceum]|uniref:Biosynthetic arginine decarboxylase n=1 Tax=Haliangium ochraceum (strain DSM 14365 / JCM 11303 / SMP-2) TaxID=502025 RepID=D0LFN4_HALO1|nr:biosynthetic arginine decarboxylase [Haliangium ochraceum]ACY12668.1 arginine decarboxylase [Haliangium ochraceum DSM 14365]